MASHLSYIVLTFVLLFFFIILLCPLPYLWSYYSFMAACFLPSTLLHFFIFLTLFCFLSLFFFLILLCSFPYPWSHYFFGTACFLPSTLLPFFMSSWSFAITVTYFLCILLFPCMLTMFTFIKRSQHQRNVATQQTWPCAWPQLCWQIPSVTFFRDVHSSYSRLSDLLLKLFCSFSCSVCHIVFIFLC